MIRLLSLALLLTALAAGAHADPHDIRVSELAAAPVLGPKGERLGRIAHVFLSVQGNGVSYAELAFRDRAGEEKRFAYPVNAFRRSPQALALNVPPAHLEKSDELELRADRRFVEAREVIGYPVDDRIGNRVGLLDDVVLNLESGRTRQYLVVFDDRPQAALPLPANLLTLQSGANPVMHADPHRRAALR